MTDFTEKMLTDMIVEEEFEIKEEEPWFDKQDLEHGNFLSVFVSEALKRNNLKAAVK